MGAAPLVRNGNSATVVRTKKASQKKSLIPAIAVVMVLAVAIGLMPSLLGTKNPYIKGTVAKTVVKAGDKIALRTTFDGIAQGTCNIYVWKQID